MKPVEEVSMMMGASTDAAAAAAAVAAAAELEEEVAIEDGCFICLDLLFEPVKLKCGHEFCKSCSIRAIGYSTTCPLCRKEKAIKRSLKIDWGTHQKLQRRYPVTMEKRRQELEGDGNDVWIRFKAVIKEVLKPGNPKHRS